jgi:hypothetical protein
MGSLQERTSNTSVSVESGAWQDLRGVHRVFVFTGGDAATSKAIVDRLSDLPLEFVQSDDDADVVLVLWNQSFSTEPDFGVPPEYRIGNAPAASGEDTATILVRAGQNHYKMLYTEQADPARRLDTARSLADWFRQALAQAGS